MADTAPRVDDTQVPRPAPFAILPQSIILPSSPLDLTAVTPEFAAGQYFGTFQSHISALASWAATFITTHSNGNHTSLATTFTRFLTLTQADCIASAASEDLTTITHSCWLIIRISLPDDEYVIPRWHQDGRMFDCSCIGTCEGGKAVPHFKYAITLLGPPTRALKESALVSSVLGTLKGGQHEARQELAEKFKGVEERHVPDGKVIRFTWGQKDSPVHSEPDYEGRHRVFASVMFGSEEEIRNMCEFRDEVYQDRPI